jgi:hypothetical protein
VARLLALALGGATKYGMDGEALGADLLALGFDAARAAAAGAFFSARRVAMAQRAADKATETGVLLDADWRFGVTVSTDDVGRVGSTYVHLRLLVEKQGATEERFLELTVPQFYTLLGGLEKAKSYVDVLGRA